MEYIFTRRSGQKVRAVLTIGDMQKIAETLARRAIQQNRKSVKALDGQIALTLEDMADKLIIVIPYGNAYGANHLALSTKEGSKTLCGRDCYGWSKAGREAEESDLESAFTCQRCVKKAKADAA